MLKNAFFNQFQSLIKSKPLKIFGKFQNRQLNWTLDFISILHGNVLHAIQRPWEGRKSGWICGQVVEFMSVYGTFSWVEFLFFLGFVKPDINKENNRKILLVFFLQWLQSSFQAFRNWVYRKIKWLCRSRTRFSQKVLLLDNFWPRG